MLQNVYMTQDWQRSKANPPVEDAKRSEVEKMRADEWFKYQAGSLELVRIQRETIAVCREVNEHYFEDPARYTKLSERLDEILKTLTGKWEQLSLALEVLLGDATDKTGSDRAHDDPLVARFYGLLESEFATDASLPDEVRLRRIGLPRGHGGPATANAEGRPSRRADAA